MADVHGASRGAKTPGNGRCGGPGQQSGQGSPPLGWAPGGSEPVGCPFTVVLDIWVFRELPGSLSPLVWPPEMPEPLQVEGRGTPGHIPSPPSGYSFL